MYKMGLNARKPVFEGFGNDKGADLPALPCNRTNAFVILILESIISKLATSAISIVYLISTAGSNLTFLETLKTGFLA